MKNVAIKHKVTGAYFDLIAREWVVGCTNNCIANYYDAKTIAELEGLTNITFEPILL